MDKLDSINSVMYVIKHQQFHQRNIQLKTSLILCCKSVASATYLHQGCEDMLDGMMRETQQEVKPALTHNQCIKCIEIESH